MAQVSRSDNKQISLAAKACSGTGSGLWVGRRFAAALLPRLFGTNPRSHHKGATGRVRTGNQRLPVLCHCQLGQDIPRVTGCDDGLPAAGLHSSWPIAPWPAAGGEAPASGRQLPIACSEEPYHGSGSSRPGRNAHSASAKENGADRYIGKVRCSSLVRADYIRPRPRARPRGHRDRLLKLLRW